MLRYQILGILVFGAGQGVIAQGTGGPPMVSGRVFDDTTGCPLRGVSLSAVGTSAKAVTDASGRYHLKGAPPSPFTLVAWLRGYAMQSAENMTVSDSAARVDFSLVRAPSDTGAKVGYPRKACRLEPADSAGRR